MHNIQFIVSFKLHSYTASYNLHDIILEYHDIMIFEYHDILISYHDILIWYFCGASQVEFCGVSQGGGVSILLEGGFAIF